MNGESMAVIGVIAGAILFGIITVGMIVSRLYRRATKELSFVRTGFGGQKVIMNGGALVLPVLHDTILVNMNTLRLEVSRSKEQATVKDLFSRRILGWAVQDTKIRWKQPW
jgi:uncharacterized membrane protein YqiK